MPKLTWDNNLINLRDILADMFWDRADSRAVVQEAGLNPAFIAFKDAAVSNWHSILDYARQDSSAVDAIIDVAIDRALPEKKQVLLLAKQHALNLRGSDITRDIAWQRPIDSEQLEKITGRQSTLLPIAFLERGLACSKAIARMDLKERGNGTGFLIRDDLLLTNHHVLEDPDQARAARVQFNYQQNLAGLSASFDEYELDPLEPGGFFRTSPTDDWSVVKVKPKDGVLPGANWSFLGLSEQDPAVNDFTIIIQHPSGGPKQIALYHNLIAYIDPNKRVIQYLTDTEPGSSGSPVFDTRWNVIALHHSGGWLREPGSDPKQKFYRNEGIHVNTILAGLRSAGIM